MKLIWTWFWFDFCGILFARSVFAMSPVTPPVAVAVATSAKTVIHAGYIGFGSATWFNYRRTSQGIGNTGLFTYDFGDWRGFNENIHLLTNVSGETVGVETIDDLQDAGVHAFGAVAGERAFGHDVELKSNKLERRLQGGIALTPPRASMNMPTTRSNLHVDHNP